MKSSFKSALRYFKYASLVFLTIYWIYIAIDDYVFIGQISGLSDFGQFIGYQFLFLLGYFLGFSFYFWLITLIVILIYHKMYKRTKKVTNN
jgi:hypothetical protein